MIKLVGVVGRGRRTGVLVVVHGVWAPLAERRSRRREEILLLSLYCVRLVSECCNSSFGGLVMISREAGCRALGSRELLTGKDAGGAKELGGGDGGGRTKSFPRRRARRLLGVLLCSIGFNLPLPLPKTEAKGAMLVF